MPTTVDVQFDDAQPFVLLPFPQMSGGKQIAETGLEVQLPEANKQVARFFSGPYVEVNLTNPDKLQAVAQVDLLINGQKDTLHIVWQAQTPLMVRQGNRLYMRKVHHAEIVRPDEAWMLYDSLLSYHSTGSATEAFRSLLLYIAKEANK